MRFTCKWLLVALWAVVVSGCAKPEYKPQAEAELERLERLALEPLRLDLGTVQQKGSEKNMVGMRSEHVLFSKRLDSRTYFIEDSRFGEGRPKGTFQGSEEELVNRSVQVLKDLDIPTGEVLRTVVMTEKLQTARYDSGAGKYIEGPIRVGRRLVELTRVVDGVPVFSSRALIGLARDGTVGFAEVHWPDIPSATAREARRLQQVVAKGWVPPEQKDARVETVEAGIIHSPALGFVLDVLPAIRVIYAPTDPTIGRKALYHFDGSGRPVPIPRTFERMDKPPLEQRKQNDQR